MQNTAEVAAILGDESVTDDVLISLSLHLQVMGIRFLSLSELIAALLTVAAQHNLAFGLMYYAWHCFRRKFVFLFFFSLTISPSAGNRELFPP